MRAAAKKTKIFLAKARRGSDWLFSNTENKLIFGN